jgi:DNA uptake protein ComE-like DNA-binding protein
MIAYREQFAKQHPGGVAFKSMNDLMRIKGIGFATVDQLSPFLTFPATDSATTRKSAPN